MAKSPIHQLLPPMLRLQVDPTLFLAPNLLTPLKNPMLQPSVQHASKIFI
jgi:hypothetical protein